MSCMRKHYRFWLIVLAMMFLVGTSKPLNYKQLTGETVEVPDGISILGEPEAKFGENGNNQGCFSEQVLDLEVELEVRNEGASPVIIEEDDVRIFVDGEEESMSEYQYSRTGVPRGAAFRVYEIEGGEEAKINLDSTAFMPYAALETTAKIELFVPIGSDELRIVFANVDEAETKTW